MGATLGGPGRPTGKAASELAEAMLLAVGELGYDAASVETVLHAKHEEVRFLSALQRKAGLLRRGCADAWERSAASWSAVPAGTPRQERLESVLLMSCALPSLPPTRPARC